MASALNFGVFLLLMCSILCRSNGTVQPQFGENDIKCLQTSHDELKDPNQSLFTWRFRNSTQGFICDFAGIQCWHNGDGKVVSVKLSGMNLGGRFPSGLKFCGSMTYLDLSGNALSGEIPKDLCRWLPFLVSIDLSNNKFSGPIPKELYNCAYLNILRLNGNQLSGQIPWELTRLERLKVFDFANNMLSGQIPSKWAVNDTRLFQENKGLCGKPLNRACAEGKSANTAFLIGAAAAGVLVVLVVCLCGLILFVRFQSRSYESLPAAP